jgi:hypothetical protein
VKQERAIRKGKAAFADFLNTWLTGIDFKTMAPETDTPQPDRTQLLRDLQNGPNGFNVLAYVKSCGGLQCAIADVTQSQDLAVQLASFIVPPASITFFDLADTYEYTNPFREKDIS